MLKYGYISEVDPDTGLFRVKFDENGIVSAPMPMIAKKTANGSEWSYLDVDDHVACLMENGWDNGVILGAIYSDDDKPQSASKDIMYIQFSDGTRLSYDRNSHELKYVVKGKITVNADGEIDFVTSGNAKYEAAILTLKATTKAIIESAAIFLGAETDATHPVAYADVVVTKLTDICDQVKTICDDLTGALVTTAMGTMPLLNMLSYQTVKAAIAAIEATLDEIKSLKVKTE